MKIIGLTGKSGSGKTKFSQILKNYGALTINLDIIGHEILKKEEPFKLILDIFGDTILTDDEIDRKKLGNVVFNDKKKLDILNEISHKYIKEQMTQIIEETKNNNEYKFIVIDGALLINAKINLICDEMWLIKSDEKNNVIRIINRDNITKDLAVKRLESQQDCSYDETFFDEIIYNNGSINKLEEIGAKLCSKLLS